MVTCTLPTTQRLTPCLLLAGSCGGVHHQAEADGMHAALKASRGSKVQYVLYPDEGHGLSRVANRVDFYGRAERLFAAVLGGRSTAASTAGGGGGLDAWLARSAAPAPKSTAKVVP